MTKPLYWRRSVWLLALGLLLGGCGGDEGPERREVAAIPSVIAPA